MSPLVSILVPVFNRQDLLPACLDSALAQTERDLEVVVVDGASTDGTWEVCRGYADRDPRVRAFRQDENAGPVLGWIRCLEEARGTFGTFLWSDDLLQPQFVAATLPSLRDSRIAFSFTAAEIGPEPGRGHVWYRHASGTMPSSTFIEGVIRGPNPNAWPVSPACGLFRLADLRRNLVAELPTQPATDLRWTGAGSDMLLFVLTATHYPLVACDERPLAFFRAHPGSLTIGSRAALVALHYTLTRAWYARTHGVGDPAAMLAQQWLRAMRHTRHLEGPRSAAKRFGGIVRPSKLTLAAARELARYGVRAIVGRNRSA